MKALSRYIQVNFKRMLKLLPVIISGTVILCGSVLVVAGLFIGNSLDNNTKKVKIGVVGDFNNYFFSSGVEALQSLDATRFIMELEQVTLEEAKKRYESGEYISYLIINDGFMDAVRNGKNDKKIDYVFGEDVKDIAGMALEEIIESFSDYITGSQSSIYAAERANEEAGNGNMSDLQIIDINTRYIGTVLNREKMGEVTRIGTGNELSTASYYLCGITVVFLFLAGIGSLIYFTGRNRSFQKLCLSKGYNIWTQLTGEYIPFLTVMIVTALIVWGFMSIVISGGFITFEEWQDAQIAGLWGIFLKIIPVMVMITIIQYFVYEIMEGIAGSVLVLFLLSIGMGYVSGCFYPEQFFPDWVQIIGNILPTGVAADYMASCVKGELSPVCIAGMTGYTAVGIVGSYLARRRVIC